MEGDCRERIGTIFYYRGADITETVEAIFEVVAKSGVVDRAEIIRHGVGGYTLNFNAENSFTGTLIGGSRCDFG